VVVKTTNEDDLIVDLAQTFANLWHYRWKLNPEKCILGVPFGKLLCFLVSHRCIEANPTKVEAIHRMNRPTGKKHVMKLTSMMAVLGLFINKLGEKGPPFSKLLKKSDKFKWTDEVDQALEVVKTFLTTPPIMVPLAPKETVLLYISASTQVVSTVLVAERPEEGHQYPVQRPVYYVSEVNPTIRSGTRNLRNCYTLFSPCHANCDITSSRTRSRLFPVSPSEKSYAAATPWDASSSGPSSWVNSTLSSAHSRPSNPRSSLISSLSGWRPSNHR
jgi:hypothetical protein